MGSFEASSNNPQDHEVQYAWPPTNTEDLIRFFEHKEANDEEYRGFTNCAWTIAESIELISRAVRANESLQIPLPHRPGEAPFNLYDEDAREPSLALKEAVYAMTGATMKVDEINGTTKYGRVWWQGRYNSIPMNFIETHTADDWGLFQAWEIVSEVPEDLIVPVEKPPIAKQHYPEKTARAILASLALQRVSTRHRHEARDKALEYYEFINSLPVTDTDIPPEFEKAA